VVIVVTGCVLGCMVADVHTDNLCIKRSALRTVKHACNATGFFHPFGESHRPGKIWGVPSPQRKCSDSQGKCGTKV
jgi:hypothetical protein